MEKKECHSSWTKSWAKKKAPADRKHAGAGIQKQCPTRMVLHLMSLNRRLGFSSLPWLCISTTHQIDGGPIIEIRWPNDGHQPTNEILVPSESWHETLKPKFSPSCFWQWPSPFFFKASLTKRVCEIGEFSAVRGRKTSSVYELVTSESSVLFWGWIY